MYGHSKIGFESREQNMYIIILKFVWSISCASLKYHCGVSVDTVSMVIEITIVSTSECPYLFHCDLDVRSMEPTCCGVWDKKPGTRGLSFTVEADMELNSVEPYSTKKENLDVDTDDCMWHASPPHSLWTMPVHLSNGEDEVRAYM